MLLIDNAGYSFGFQVFIILFKLENGVPILNYYED